MNYQNKQTGLAPIIIFIAVAVVIGLAAVAYGYFISKKPQDTLPRQTVPLTREDPIETQAKLGTPECPELDYTGCDKSGEFMTWDGTYQEPTPPFDPNSDK